MKSERAKKYIDNDAIVMRNGDRMVDASTAYMAIELAEQDAEMRMREKAHKIIKEMMEGVFQGNMPQNIADEFSQKLNEE
ncbi:MULTISPECIES: hypothetical protein [Alistipes]|uniref:hypothetical protein n=1 Tax=Alistipes TaxID=239759 RepID=UPI001B3A1220|nr:MULTISPECIES: hypothetical protein [Alistipes]MBQ4904158.1 hypothetical protein [Alistipes sp. Marseille-P2263]MCI2258239.1 hypothetical protein [Alistipes dispar]